MDITTTAAVLLAAASPIVLTSLGDEFDSGASLNEWNTIQGDFADGGPTTFGVHDGALSIVSSHASWVNNRRAFYLWKRVEGDFTVTARVRADGVSGPVPNANWSLSGLLLRAPMADGQRENWVGWTVGYVNGASVVERKTTRQSNSVLRLSLVPAGWIELRAARIGPVVALLRRSPGKRWVLQGSYTRHDLPDALQAGIDAQSGFDSARADLRSRVDWIRFADTGVPPRLRAAFLNGRRRLPALMRYLTR
jgi:hypothetical protein